MLNIKIEDQKMYAEQCQTSITMYNAMYVHLFNRLGYPVRVGLVNDHVLDSR
jgi:hypothetical protein